jgi:hypothetical protein
MCMGSVKTTLAVVGPVFFMVLAGCGSGREQMLARRWGFIDKTGKLVIPPRFRDSYVPAWVNPYGKPSGDFSEGLAGLILDKDARGDHRGYIDRNGNVVLELPNAVVVGRFSEGLAAVGSNCSPKPTSSRRCFRYRAEIRGFIMNSGGRRSRRAKAVA